MDISDSEDNISLREKNRLLSQQNSFLQEELDKRSLELEKSLIKNETRQDRLTEIDNYYTLLDMLKSKKQVTIILLDIDNFNNINNAYGFNIGDDVLVQTVKYLGLIKPHNAQLFRFESDKFALLIEDDVSKEKLTSIAETILSFFNESEISLENEIDIKISFSIGIAQGKDISILNDAKSAIKELRKYKRGTYGYYDSNVTSLTKQHDNIYWINKIKEAVSERKLIPYFQPIINNKTKKIEKYECLARIKDVEELIPPIRFMEAAKLTGMLPHITRAMIEQSFKKFSTNDYEFSINITSEDLYMDYLEEFLLKYVLKYNINPSRVVLEILENIASISQPYILEQLYSLRKKGFKIAIDDFGSESSNLSRLLDFNPDYLKIDGSFIKNILEDEKSLIITEAIILIAHKSNIKVIAEFVHNKDVQAKIVELGIDYSQGYYFSEPKHDLE